MPTALKNKPRTKRRADTIMMTTRDHERLSLLVERYAEGRFAELAEALDDELARARLVTPSAIPPDIVTMNSTCVFRFADTDERREVTVVFPENADVDAQRVSVLAPIGAALIGLGEGQSIRWPTPEGERELELISVTYQPEAEGHRHL